MSTTAIAVSTAQSSAAIAAARAAERRACEGIVGNFDAHGATVEAMRIYADCVDLLHPDPMTGDQVSLLKYFLIACFIGSGVGIWWCNNDDFIDHTIGDTIMGFILGFVGTGLGLFLIGLVIAAIAFIFGA